VAIAKPPQAIPIPIAANVLVSAEMSDKNKVQTNANMAIVANVYFIDLLLCILIKLYFNSKSKPQAPSGGWF